MYLCVGIPTSKYETSQQWDFPNAWPPLQAFIIQGLDRTEQKLAQKVAVELTKIWLHTNYTGFAEKSVMFEKVCTYLPILNSLYNIF